MTTCYIVGAGSFTGRDFAPGQNDFVIAADGGYCALEKLRYTPDVLLGDFDSLPQLPQTLPPQVTVSRYPVEKDDTDTGIALQTGFNLGYRNFMLYGCGGGRPDHLLANLQSMCRYQKQGAQLRLVDPDYDIYSLHNATMVLPQRPPDTLVSVFCHGDNARGVTLKGLKYSLNNATLTCDYPLGVSNHYTRQAPQVSVENGTLLIMVYHTAV